MLATYLGQPDLMRRSWRFLGIRLKGRPAPDAMTHRERWSLVFLAIGIAIVSIVYVGRIWMEIDNDAVQSMGGFGSLLVLAVFVASGLYFYSLRRFGKKLKAMRQRGGFGRGGYQTGGGQ